MLAAVVIVVLLPFSYYAHTYIYQSVAGLFCVIVLAQYVFPAIMLPDRVSSLAIALGGLLSASLPFLGIHYLPAGVLLFLCRLRTRFVGREFAWFALGVGFNVAVLMWLGSIRGHLAYHIYLNGVVLPQFSRAADLSALPRLAMQSITSQGAVFLIVISALVAAASWHYVKPPRILGTLCLHRLLRFHFLCATPPAAWLRA